MPALPRPVRHDRGHFTWEPTYYVTKLEQRDATHIDFELTEGLCGRAATARSPPTDVKFSYERMKDSDWSGYFDALDHVEVTGERTGTIVLSKPFAPFIMITLCHGPGAVLSEKAMADAGGKFTTKFPGVCGPYTYEATPGQRAVFRQPRLDRAETGLRPVECNVITEVKAAELAFEAGELDCTEVGADTLARYTKNMPEGTGIAVAGELQYMWMGMNTEHPKLQDIRVRQAIQHAVDVDTILQGAYSGTTAKSHGIICPGLTGERDSAGYSYDPAKARALLDEAGVSGLEVTLRTLNNQERMLAAQIIQANLAAVGSPSMCCRSTAARSGKWVRRARATPGRTLSCGSCASAPRPTPTRRRSGSPPNQVGVWNWERWTRRGIRPALR